MNGIRANCQFLKVTLEMSEGHRIRIVLVLPSDEREGMFEDLVMDVVTKTLFSKCVDKYIQLCYAKST